MAGSLIWVCYGIAQKLLLKQFKSQQILMMIYLCCGISFSPFCEPRPNWQYQHAFCMGLLYLLLFEYLDCLWLLRRGTEFVGYLQSECSHHDDPHFDTFFDFRARDFPETFASLEMNWISYLGAIVVVLGAMMAAVGYKIFGK